MSDVDVQRGAEGRGVSTKRRKRAPISGEEILETLRATLHAMTIAARPTRMGERHGRAAVATLRVLAREGGPVPLADVARHLGCSRANVTQLAERLARYGFARIVDVPAAGGFNGGRNLVITDVGREVVSGSAAREARAAEYAIAPLNERERRALVRLLERCKRSSQDLRSRVRTADRLSPRTAIWLDPFVTREVREFKDAIDDLDEAPEPEPTCGFAEPYKEFRCRWDAWWYRHLGQHEQAREAEARLAELRNERMRGERAREEKRREEEEERARAERSRQEERANEEDEERMRAEERARAEGRPDEGWGWWERQLTS